MVSEKQTQSLRFHSPSLPLLLTYIPSAHCRGKTEIDNTFFLPVVKMERFALLVEGVQHLGNFGQGSGLGA